MRRDDLMEMWGEYFMYNTVFTQLPVGTGVSFATQEIRIDSDADFQFMKSMYFSDSDGASVFVKYKDDSTGRYLLKNAVELRTIAGRSLPIDASGSFDFRPYIWPVAYSIRRATTFSVEAANSHPLLTPTVYLSFQGAKLRQGIAPWRRRNVEKMPYVYSLPRSINTLPESVVRLAANQTASVSVSVDKDSDFVVNKITGSATGAALVTIQEMGRDRQWMNNSTHIRNLIGSGAFPNVLAVPRFVPRGSVVNFSIQDISGAQNDISINMSGVKLFDLR